DQGLMKAAGGALVLSGANTYRNGTHIAGGVLQVSSDANLGAAATSQERQLTLNNLATLRVAGSDYHRTQRDLVLSGDGGTLEIVERTDAGGAPRRFTLDGAVSGTGELRLAGAGAV